MRHAFDASHAGAAGGAAAQPGQCARGRRPDADTPIDVAYIGACTGAKLDDLRAAAQVLRGYRVAAGVQLLVAPASLRDARRPQAEGILRRLREAGADAAAQRLRRLRRLRQRASPKAAP